MLQFLWQAMSAGERLRATIEESSGSKPYNLFFYTSPYLRSRQVRGRGLPRKAVAWGLSAMRLCKEQQETNQITCCLPRLPLILLSSSLPDL